jgi:hypothetical protein
MVEEIEILGHTLGHGIVSPSKSKVQAIQQIKIPVNIPQLQAFLGLANFYRSFIPKFASFEETLRSSIINGTIKWKNEHTKAWNELKNKICEIPSKYPVQDWSNPKFELHCDASQNYIASVLIQVVDDQEYPVSFFSKMLSRAKKNYSTTQKELEAIYESVKHFHKFLAPYRFIIKTDHAPLVNMAINKKSSMGVKWDARLAFISSYDFVLEYKKGSENQIPDSLTRVNNITINFEPLSEAQRLDQNVQDIISNNEGKILVDDEVYYFVDKEGRKRIILPQMYRYHAFKKLTVDIHHPKRLTGN